LSMKAGCHGDMINGLEALLPTGELIRTGSISVSPFWFGRYPLPDFSGLFINWKGTSGIVTKMAIQLWPKLDFEDFYAIGIWEIEHYSDVVGRLAKSEIVDEQSGRGREIMEVAFGLYKPGKRTLPWDMFVMNKISGATKRIFDAKVEAFKEIVEDETKKGHRTEILWDFSANDKARYVSKFPTTGFAVTWMDLCREGIVKAGGGATWVGAYTLISEYAKGYKSVEKILSKYKFATMGSSRTMGTSRYTILRFLIPYNRADAEEVKDIRNMMREIAQSDLNQGALMYKAPEWASELMWGKADPGYLNFLKKMKSFLDPNDIMNPEKLGI
jgi:FAD/FMN-containing dehydrogenase